MWIFWSVKRMSKLVLLNKRLLLLVASNLTLVILDAMATKTQTCPISPH